jgi:hypothetical protein
MDSAVPRIRSCTTRLHTQRAKVGGFEDKLTSVDFFPSSLLVARLSRKSKEGGIGAILRNGRTRRDNLSLS